MPRVIEGEDILKTDRLVLEPITSGHASSLFEVLGEPKVYDYIPEDPPAELADLVARYTQLESRQSPTGDQVWLNWAIRLKGEKAYLGRVEATVYDDGSAGVAYLLGSRFWGHGYASEAVRRILGLLFETYKCPEVFAEVDTENIASIRLLERLGFKQAGVKREADHFKGRTSDEYKYTLSRDHWRSGRAEPKDETPR